jgi:hypothetical protein
MKRLSVKALHMFVTMVTLFAPVGIILVIMEFARPDRPEPLLMGGALLVPLFVGAAVWVDKLFTGEATLGIELPKWPKPSGDEDYGRDSVKQEARDE